MPLETSEFSADDTEYGEDFAASVANEIGDSLFSSTKPALADSTADAGTTPVEKAETAPMVEKPAVEAPPAIIPGQNSVGRPLPKSWKKDMAPLWEKSDPALHEYVYAREADVMRGLQGYQQGHNQWNSLIQPFAPIFQQNPDVQPIALMQGLMNTHLQLLNPSMASEKKLEMARGILADYGIDLGQAAAAPQNDPLILQLRNEVRALQQAQQTQEQARQNQEQAAHEAGVAQHLSLVQTFATDPKNEFFDEVGNDIFRFIQTGAATDLQSAYDLACYANPAVRVKMLAKQQQPAASVLQRNKTGRFINVEGDNAPAVRNHKGSIDSTIDNIVNSHYSKSH